MTRTYLPRAVDAGARLVTGCRIDASGDGRAHAPPGAPRRWPTVARGSIRFRHVFVCGGAIQTPALLQRSRDRRPHRPIAGGASDRQARGALRRRAERPRRRAGASGQGVRARPVVRRLGQPARSRRAGAERPVVARSARAITDWRRISVYYAAITSEGRGRVRAVPRPARPDRHLPADPPRPRPAAAAGWPGWRC